MDSSGQYKKMLTGLLTGIKVLLAFESFANIAKDGPFPWLFISLLIVVDLILLYDFRFVIGGREVVRPEQTAEQSAPMQKNSHKELKLICTVIVAAAKTVVILIILKHALFDQQISGLLFGGVLAYEVILACDYFRTLTAEMTDEKAAKRKRISEQAKLQSHTSPEDTRMAEEIRSNTTGNDLAADEMVSLLQGNHRKTESSKNH